MIGICTFLPIEVTLQRGFRVRPSREDQPKRPRAGNRPSRVRCTGQVPFVVARSDGISEDFPSAKFPGHSSTLWAHLSPRALSRISHLAVHESWGIVEYEPARQSLPRDADIVAIRHEVFSFKLEGGPRDGGRRDDRVARLIELHGPDGVTRWLTRRSTGTLTEAQSQRLGVEARARAQQPCVWRENPYFPPLPRKAVCVER